MITSLLIDGVEYKDYIREDRDNKLTLQIEREINNPVNSYYEVVLTNEGSLQNTFSSKPYTLFEKGHLELYYNNVKVFRGYLDRDSNTIRNNVTDLELKAYGYEKKISTELERHDISQLYYNPGPGSRSQRGGRTTVQRFEWGKDFYQYNNIYFLVLTMCDDIGYNNTKVLIKYTGDFADPDYFRHGYEIKKYGNLNDLFPVSKLRNTGGRGLADTSSNLLSPFFKNSNDTQSYNIFMKKFASITGSVFFYDYTSDKLVFAERDNVNVLLNKPTINLDNIILDNEDYEDYIIQPYDGFMLRFTDLDLGVKIDYNSTTDTYTFQYGLGGINIRPEFTQIFYYDAGQGGWIFEGNDAYGDGYVGIWGLDEPVKDLVLNNALIIEIEDSWTDFYISFGGDNRTVKTFLDKTLSNYFFSVVRKYKKAEFTVDGVYFTPMKGIYKGIAQTILWSEIDFNLKNTKLKFDY